VLLDVCRALPDTIRVLGWTDKPGPDFSARFSCRSREYKYFIVQDGSLNVEAMKEAAQYLLGEHDYRNFCKADVLQVRVAERRREVLWDTVGGGGAGAACPTEWGGRRRHSTI
jgi:tRNA pseudouridine(38-40) synthase